jgi:hypothetical protein
MVLRAEHGQAITTSETLGIGSEGFHMNPFLLWVVFSAGLGWSVHKKKWGIAAFFGAMLAWVAIIQIATALLEIAIAGTAARTGSLTSF